MNPLTWQIEPLGPWNRPVTRNRRPAGRFTATWGDTRRLLDNELGHLGATGVVALRLDVTEADVVRDGSRLRAHVRTASPAAALSFTSRHGPLTYATDVYDSWQANVRALALSLQALRAVDRYGVSRSGEQYAGWRALAAGPTTTGFASVTEALAWLRAQPDIGSTVDSTVAEMLQRAGKVMHPDINAGDRSRWDRLDQARRLIERHGATR